MTFEDQALNGLGTQVYDYICKEIFSGRLKQGDRLNEVEIGEKCGTSRTPVRQALKQLEHDGIIEIVPNRYAQVCTLTDGQIKQVGEARILFDWIIARLVVHYGADADFVCLKNQINDCKEHIDDSDLYTRVSNDTYFHFALANIGKNNVILSFLRKVLLSSGVAQAARYSDTEVYQKQIDEHERIVNSLLSRDVSNLRDNMINGLVDFYGIDEAEIEHTLQHNKDNGGTGK